jgi:hypothetical protein
MMGKFFRKIATEKQCEQHKSAYMGRKRFGRGFGLLAGLKEEKVLESGMLIGVFMARGLGQGSKRCREKA